MTRCGCVLRRVAQCVAALLLLCIFGVLSCGAAIKEAVQLSGDGKCFVLHESQKQFVPYGFNYAPQNQLIEDCWDTRWNEIVSDFNEMKQMGTSVARIHLQMARFMTTPDDLSSSALAHLARLLDLATSTGIYIDITGLACYRPADLPRWFNELSQEKRWAVQQRFWEGIASECTSSPAVFCYDLINEAIVPSEPRGPGQWYTGEFGGFQFCQYVGLNLGGKPRDVFGRDWIRLMVQAIRKHDRNHLVTIGLLPWEAKLGHSSGFVPKLIAPELDFLCVHIYPERGKGDEALVCLRQFQTGKPVVIEETFPLFCGVDELEPFLLKSRDGASGWIGHYFGTTIAEFEGRQRDKTATVSDLMMMEWLKLYERLRPQLTR